MILWLVGFTILLHVSMATEPKRTIILSQILYRHGDRSPVRIFPTDINKDKWTDGLGQLTNIGKRQQFDLGVFLRQRYMSVDQPLLNSVYKHYEIHVRSTDVERTLMSAESNLAGLYPPLTLGELWSKTIKWQPIPVHTMPQDQDITLNDDFECPRATELYKKAMNSDKIKKINKDNIEFFKFVKVKSGLPLVDLSTIWSISDTLFCEKAHNMSLQPWLTKSWKGISIYDHLRNLNDIQFDLLFDGDDELSRLRGGPLLKEMLGHMEYTVNNLNDTNLTKLFMYSAHDSTVGALLSALHVFNKRSPTYASCVFVELFKEEHATGLIQFSVRLSYKNDTRVKPYLLTHPGCSEFCEMKKFIKLSKPLIPVDYTRECRGTSSKEIIKDNIVLALSMCLCVVTVCLLCTVFAYVRSYRARKRYDAYRSLSNSDSLIA